MSRTFWIAVIVTLVVALFGVITLPDAKTLVSVELETEALESHVFNPERSTFELPIAQILSDSVDTCASEIKVVPSKEAEIVYTSQPNGELVVTINGAGNWYSSNSARTATEDFAMFRVGPGLGDCSYSGHVRLPVAGSLSAGLQVAALREDGEPLTVLRSATAQVQGRSIDRVFGLIPLGWFSSFTPLEPNRLFFVESWEIPAGSRLESENARWWGYMDVEVGAPNDAMKVFASSNTNEVRLYAPAPFETRSGLVAHDTISMTLSNRLAADPNLKWLLAVLSFVLVIVGIFAQMTSGKD